MRMRLVKSQIVGKVMCYLVSVSIALAITFSLAFVFATSQPESESAGFQVAIEKPCRELDREALFAAAALASPTLQNEHVSIIINRDGAFTMRRSLDGKWLLFPAPGTTAFSVKVDDAVYWTRRSLPVSTPLTIVDASNAYIEYTTPENVRIRHTFTLAGEAVRFTVQVWNNDFVTRRVQVRYLFDTQVDRNDGSPLSALGVVDFRGSPIVMYETDIPFVAFSEWKGYDRWPNPTLVARGTISTRPSRMVFAWWPNAIRTAWDYTPDPHQRFYTPGYIRSPRSDSCVLIFFDLGSIAPGGTASTVTYYGIGPPVGIDPSAILYKLESVRQQARTAIIASFNDVAAGMAKAYVKRGEDYARSLINYARYRAGMIGPHWIDETFRQTANMLFVEPFLTPQRAQELYNSLANMFAMVNPFMTEPEVKAAFQHHISLYRDAVLTDFDGQFDLIMVDIVNSLPHLNLSPAEVELLIRIPTIKAGRLIRTHNADFVRFVGDLQEGELQRVFFSRLDAELDNPFFIPIIWAVGVVIKKAAIGGTVKKALAYYGKIIGIAAVTEAGEIVAEKTCVAVGGHPQACKIVVDIASFGVSVATFNKVDLKGDIEEIVSAGMAISGWGKDTLTLGRHVLEHELMTQQESTLEIIEFVANKITMPFDDEGQLGREYGWITVQNTGPIAINLVNNIQIQTNAPMQRITITSIPSVLEPHTQGTIHFQYVVNLPDIDEMICNVYQIIATIWASDLNMVSATTQFAVWNAAVPGEQEAVESISHTNLSSGVLKAGQSSGLQSFTTRADTRQHVWTLLYSGSDLNLHLFDAFGNHVGVNYATGEIEVQIPHAIYSGPEANPEWIEISGGAGFENFTVKAVAIHTGILGTPYALSVTEVPFLPAILKVSPTLIEKTMEAGQTLEILIRCRETAGQQDYIGLVASSTDLVSGLNIITSQNITFHVPSPQVPAGGWVDVTVTINVPSDTFSGTYSGTIHLGTGPVKVPVSLEVFGITPVVDPDPDRLCFIATAVFGTPMAEEVEVLRRFRDQHLLTNELGRRFVSFYYQHSPALAEFISDREWAKRAMRIVLSPLVRMAELIVGGEEGCR